MPSSKYQSILKEFRRIGRITYELGYNNTHSGNISVRVGDKILINRRAAMLGFLEDKDIVEVPLNKESPADNKASVELNSHRAILRNTPAKAVLHMHPPKTIALSLIMKSVPPITVEGKLFFRKPVPVLVLKHATGSKEMEKALVKALKTHPMAIVRGHGTFTVGQTIEECLRYASMLEDSSNITFLTRLLKAKR
ncbi:MAG: class II aldolase/adducin family protein [Planctomycetes bacterium]|nr:class II aldolase/adducin family protein [Planctomycetota bacterium]